MTTFLRAAAAVALVTPLLAGCALGAGGPQTVIQGCMELKPALLSATDEMTSAFDELQADPSGAVPLLRGVSSDLRDAIAEVENPDVVDVATTAVDTMDRMTDEIEKVLDGTGDQATLQREANQVQVDFDAIDTVCEAG